MLVRDDLQVEDPNALPVASHSLPQLGVAKEREHGRGKSGWVTRLNEKRMLTRDEVVRRATNPGLTTGSPASIASASTVGNPSFQ